jgi:hypothetical protein
MKTFAFYSKSNNDVVIINAYTREEARVVLFDDLRHRSIIIQDDYVLMTVLTCRAGAVTGFSTNV